MVASANRKIPEATVSRLPVYRRILNERLRSGQSTVSSDQLAELAGVNASKVRKDLSLLGSFGTRGSGYNTDYLLDQIEQSLDLDGTWPVVVVGVGNLGRALVRSPGFLTRGFEMMGLFDVDPQLVGTSLDGIIIQHVDQIEDCVDGTPPAIGVIATPAGAAQSVADRLVSVGVRALLNFAPQVLSVPDGVLLRSVDLSIELEIISFLLSHGAHEGRLGSQQDDRFEPEDALSSFEL